MIRRIKKAIKSIIAEPEKREEAKPNEETEGAEKKAPKMEMLFLDQVHLVVLRNQNRPKSYGSFSEVEQERLQNLYTLFFI